MVVGIEARGLQADDQISQTAQLRVIPQRLLAEDVLDRSMIEGAINATKLDRIGERVRQEDFRAKSGKSVKGGIVCRAYGTTPEGGTLGAVSRRLSAVRSSRCECGLVDVTILRPRRVHPVSVHRLQDVPYGI